MFRQQTATTSTLTHVRLSRVYTRASWALGNMLPATCCLLPSIKLCQLVARLLLDTKGYMLPRYRHMLPATSNMLPGSMLLVYGNICRQHVAGQHVAWCKRGFRHVSSCLRDIHHALEQQLTGNSHSCIRRRSFPSDKLDLFIIVKPLRFPSCRIA